MATTTNSQESSDSHEESQEQINFAEATLAEFGDSWKRPGDFADKAEILGVTPEVCEKQITRTTTAVESRETTQVPPSEYEAFEEERIPFENRYDIAQAEFPDETVSYVCEATSIDTCERCTGEGQLSCPNCTTGKTTCSTCAGDGMETCSQCKGWNQAGGRGRITCPDCHADGTVTRNGESITCSSCGGSGHVMCNSCSGNGEHRCTNCGGGGIVTCGTCGGSTYVMCGDCRGETQLVTVDIGEIEFSSSETVAGVSTIGVPERYITAHPGMKFKTDEEWTDVSELDTETTVREEVEHRKVDVTKIDYTYDDSEYSVFDVEGSIRAESYPKSGTRSIVPYAIVAVMIALLGYGVYQYVL